MASESKFNVGFVIKARDLASSIFKKASANAKASIDAVERSSDMSSSALVSKTTNARQRLVSGSISTFRQPLNQTSKAAGVFSERLRDVGGSALKMSAAVGIGGFALAKMAGMAGEIERLEFRLKAVNKGDAAQTSKELGFISETARRSAFNVKELTNAFVLLKNARLDPEGGGLVDLTDAVAKVGGSGDDLAEISRQFLKMSSIGKIQMESLDRLQVLGINPMEELAKAAGATSENVIEMTEEFGKLMSLGKLGRKEIAVLLHQLGKSARGSSSEFANTYVGTLSMIQDKFAAFGQNLKRAGFLDVMRDGIKFFLDGFDEMNRAGEVSVVTSGITKLAKSFVDISKSIGSSVMSVIKAASPFSSMIISLAKLGAFFIAFSAAAKIGGLLIAAGKLFGALHPVIKALSVAFIAADMFHRSTFGEIGKKKDVAEEGIRDLRGRRFDEMRRLSGGGSSSLPDFLKKDFVSGKIDINITKEGGVEVRNNNPERLTINKSRGILHTIIGSHL